MKEAALVKGDNATVRATSEQADLTYRQVKREISGLRLTRDQDIRAAKVQAEKATVEARKRWDSTRGELKKLHDSQRGQLRDEHYAQRSIDGELAQVARDHLKALRDFHRAVWDHPTDNYRDMRTVLYQKNLLDGLHNAELIDATEKRLAKAMGEDRVTALREDPARLREAVAVFVSDVYDNPSTFDPRLVDQVKAAKQAANRAAIDEINRILAAEELQA